MSVLGKIVRKGNGNGLLSLLGQILVAHAVTWNRFQARLLPTSRVFKSAQRSVQTVHNRLKTMPTTLRLNCLIKGEGISFPVTVGNVEVGDLKNEIKKQCAVSFENVDAHHLELWKVNAIDDPLCEMTLLFLAQGPQLHCRQAKQHSH